MQFQQSARTLIRYVACGLVLLVGSCDACPADPSSSEHLAFSVLLINNDEGAAVHIFALNETFPCCRLGPATDQDNIRTVNLSGISSGSKVRFSVGRNGEVFKSVDCQAEDDGPDKNVTWAPTAPGANTGSLRCNDW